MTSVPSTGVTGTLVLVRHAQSTWVAEGRFQGRLDPPLSPLGEEQARRVARWLATPGGPPGLGLPSAPRAIVHSPLTRVRQTADSIAAALAASHGPEASSPMRPDDRLIEIGVGDWSGLTIEQVDARWRAEHAAWRRDPLGTTPPRGESLADADRRARDAIPALLAALRPRRDPGGPTARDPADHDAPRGESAVPEPQPWSIVVAHGGILRLLLFALLDLPLDRFWAFPFALASVSVVEIASGRGSLLAHNLAEHLAGIEGAAGGLRTF